jgi:glycerol kinase
VFFKVQEIITGENGEKTAILKGLEMRLIADAGLEDLMQLWRCERTFVPTLGRDAAAEKMARWEHAVRQTVAP